MLGVQAGILRGPLTHDFEGTLARLPAIGITSLELQWYGGNFGRSPRQVRAACDAAGVHVTSALIRAGAVLVGWSRHLDAAGELGLRYLAVVNLSEDEVQSIDDWREWADRFTQAGAVARKAGLWLALHNEPAFMTPMDGRVPYDEFIARTDQACVALSMDAANMVRGGADPVAYLRTHGARYRLGHLKDVTPGGAVGGRFGDGRVRWRTLLPHLSEEASRHQFVEHPLSASDPLADLDAISRRLLTAGTPRRSRAADGTSAELRADAGKEGGRVGPRPRRPPVHAGKWPLRGEADRLQRLAPAGLRIGDVDDDPAARVVVQTPSHQPPRTSLIRRGKRAEMIERVTVPAQDEALCGVMTHPGELGRACREPLEHDAAVHAAGTRVEHVHAGQVRGPRDARLVHAAVDGRREV